MGSEYPRMKSAAVIGEANRRARNDDVRSLAISMPENNKTNTGA